MGLILLLALAGGAAVGNVYFPQIVGPSVAAGLGVAPGTAAQVVTATQFGYAAGIVLLVPLGDRIPHRRLIVGLLALTGLGLLAAGSAPTLEALLAAGVFTGAVTVAAPVIGPMAAGLVSEDRRGMVSGMLLSGGLGGMLLSRTFGGALAEWLGWRAPYLVAAALVLVIALVLLRVLPATIPPSAQPYPALVAGSLRLLRTEPQLRRSCLYQATVFAGFSAVWTSVTLLLTGPAYGESVDTASPHLMCSTLRGRRHRRQLIRVVRSRNSRSWAAAASGEVRSMFWMKPCIRPGSCRCVTRTPACARR